MTVTESSPTQVKAEAVTAATILIAAIKESANDSPIYVINSLLSILATVVSSPATDADQRGDYQGIIDGKLTEIGQSQNPFNPTVVVNPDALGTFTAECVALVAAIGQVASNYFTLWWVATLVSTLDDEVDSHLGVSPDLSAGALSGSD
jgi:hypothetical protein